MSSYKKILLTTSAAPSQSPFSTIEKRPPLGVGFLISVLRNAGHEVFFIDNYLNPSDFLETDYLQFNKIDIVGIYANTICYRDTLRMLHKLEYLRQTGKWKGKIVLGGPHTTVALDTIPEFVDHVVQGEGEYALLDIAEGKVRQRLVNYPRIKNLDELPMPAWDYFVPLPYNWHVDWFPEDPVFTMNTSRGCPFSCRFCSVGSIWGKNYTYFSAERVISDIEYLIEHYGAKGIYFREDNFTLHKKRLVRFCNLLLEKGIKIPWACETRVSSLDRDTVELMSRSGVCGFYFGVESGSQRILNFLKKGITVDQTRNAFALCHEYGIKTAASVVVGVPTETDEDVKQTITLLKDLKPTTTWFNVFVGIPDSELYQYTIKNNLHEFIDDRGLVYLKGHNKRTRIYYGKHINAEIPAFVSQGDKAVEPKISVVMSVYNGAKYLEKAILSILRQSFQNFEFIIIDDSSTDSTPDILAGFNDPRIKILRNPRRLGLTKSLNIGIREARGTYIARMDADDISLPHRLVTQYNFLKDNPECVLVGSSYYSIDENGKTKSLVTVLTDHQEIKTGMQKQNWFGHGTILMRKDIFIQCGGYNEEFIYAQDYDLWLRMSEKFKVANIKEPLYCWRITENCISKEKGNEQKKYAQLAISRSKSRANRSLNKSEDSTSMNLLPQGKPLVSVIVPTYNRPQMLRDAIESILSQTYVNFEIIVVNDCGQDVGGLVQELNHRGNITYARHGRNRGLAAARNTGIKLARGKYIAYLDDDDIFYPDHLETLVGCLEQNACQVAYTDAYRAHQVYKDGTYQITKRDIPYSIDFSRDILLIMNISPVNCFMHTKKCLDDVGLFDEDFHAHEDWELWVRISRKYDFMHIKKVTTEFRWRTDGSTMSSGSRHEFIRTMEEIFRRYQSDAQDKTEVIQRQKSTLRYLWSQIAQQEGNKNCSIIIPVFNKLELTKQCLEALKANTPVELYEVIVIDNASSDGTAEFLNTLTNDVKVITNKKNVGFAKACNQGAEAAQGAYLLFLNNDTEPQKGWLEPLLTILDNDQTVAAVGSKLLFPEGTIQHAGVLIIEDRKLPDLLVARHIYYQQPPDLPEANQLRTYQALTAACLLMRKDSFVKAGGFDEEYWNGYEDIDLCFKLQEDGSRLVYQPESVVIHHESQSGPERFKKVHHNINRLHDRWLGKIKPDVIINADGKIADTDANRIQPYVIPVHNKSVVESMPSGNKTDLVSIIMLTFNQLRYTKKCVESIELHTSVPYEIIFVDNGSTDDTPDYLTEYAKSHDNVVIILNEENRGFARGNNQGIAQARGNYILLLNNDVIVTEHWLERLISHMKRHPDIGMVGPMSNSVSGPQLVQDVPYGNSMKAMHEFALDFAATNSGKTDDIMRLVGFCLLIRKDVIDVIGGLDENYVSGNFEDDDLCLRSFIAGYRNVMAGDVFIHHYGSMTFKGNAIDYQATMNDNRRYFAAKWKDIVEVDGNHYKVCFTRDQQIKKLLDWGEERFSQGNLPSAIEVFQRILQIDKANSQALNDLGVIQWQIGDMASAMETFQIALRFNPNDLDALANLQQAATETGKFDLIKPNLLDMLNQAHPTNPDLARPINAKQEMYGDA